MSVNAVFIVGVTAGDRRSTVVGIPPKGTERKTTEIFVIATVGAAQRTTDKLVSSVYLHRLLNSCGPHCHPRIVRVDKGDALLLAVPPHRANSWP